MFAFKRGAVPAGAIAVTLGLAVAGCGSSTSSSSTGTGSGSGTTPAAKAGGKLKSVLFVNPLPKNPQWRLIGDCVSKEAKARGIPATETGPTGNLDPVTMVNQIQQGIASKSGAILTYPASPAFGPVLKQATSAGIITGTMYGGADSAVGQFNTGVDWGALGEQYVAALAGRPGKQVVGLLAVSPTGVGKAFVDGFKAAAAKTSNVTVKAAAYTDDDPAKTLTQVNALLQANPDINVVASHMGTSTTPVISAIKAKKKVGKVVFMGNGATGGGSQGAKAGIVYKFLLQDLCTEGKSAVDAAADLAAGKKVAKDLPIATVMAGLNDYQSYLNKGWM
jgi:ABC-type sugar transport system substrate-binding protein